MTNGENVVTGIFSGPLGMLMAVQLGAVGANSLIGAAIYAAVGATVGFCTTFFLKRLFKWLNINTD
ncbi:hypothetical protein GCM10023185_15480 [Hymenobacter saemangeumensis]|uniref:Uncharacterized protein n=1 Tax=Hymenobacter saemangeumensis TaxID=1084522 RepID=A0ABP8I9N1_9BACT